MFWSHPAFAVLFSSPNACPMQGYSDGCDAALAYYGANAGAIERPHVLDRNSVVSLEIIPCTTTTSGCTTPYTNSFPSYLNWTSSSGCTTPATGTIAVRNGGLGGADLNYENGGNGIEGLFTITSGGSGCSGAVTIPIPAGAGSGSGGSITGIVQTVRPPWNVAGVDYYVGAPTGALTGWDTLFASGACSSSCNVDGANWSYNSSSGQLTCNSGSAVLDRIDWTTGTSLLNGIYSDATNCNITMTNSKFGCMPNSGSIMGPTMNFEQGMPNGFVFEYNTVDFSACTPQNTVAGGVDWLSLGVLSQSILPSVLIEYNFFHDLPEGVANLEFDGGGNVSSAQIRYNMMWNVAYFPGSPSNHMHLIQWGAASIGSLNGVDVSYNTVAEEGADSGGEGFQFYSQGGTSTKPVWQAPNYSNNTILNVSCNCIGNFTDAGQVGSTNGEYVNGIDDDNYFNTTQTNPWYEPSSMSPSQGGWSSAGNIRLQDGASISP